MLVRIILILFVSQALAFRVKAQSRSLPFLELNADTRTAGMGDAFTGESPGMYLYTNPTSFLRKDAMLYTSYTIGIYPKFNNETKKYHALSAGYRFNKQALMVGFRYINNYSFHRVDPNGNQHKKIYPMDWAIDMAFSRSLNKHFSVFAGGNFIQSYINKIAYTVSATAGVYYRNEHAGGNGGGDYTIGLSLYDFGGKVKYGIGRSVGLPASIVLGGSVLLPFCDEHKLNMVLTTRYFVPSDASEFTLGIGAEYVLFDVLSLRGGYHYGKTLSYGTFGLGGDYKFVRLDISYQLADSKSDINVVRFGVSIAF